LIFIFIQINIAVQRMHKYKIKTLITKQRWLDFSFLGLSEANTYSDTKKKNKYIEHCSLSFGWRKKNPINIRPIPVIKSNMWFEIQSKQ
jgi:hypothetical protein